MKPKFAYLHIAFIVSIVILVVLTFLFYNRLNSHVRYTGEFNSTYSVVLSLRGLEESMSEMESNARGFLLLKDSTLIKGYASNRDSVNRYLDTLRNIIADNSDQMRRFLLMRSTALQQLTIYHRLIQLDSSESEQSLRILLMRSKRLMDSFRDELRQIEKAEVRQRDELLKTKDFYETFYPNYFNTISIWAGIITLVSFYFINREVKTRRRYQAELEKRLHELNRSNSELRQFAYIASHDLQEPLRKIRTFSDKLVYKHQHSIDEEAKTVISRIEAAAKRMQELIQDMLNFTMLVNKEGGLTKVDLNDLIPKVLSYYVELSRERHAIITWDNLPEIDGNEEQLSLLFKSLIDNAFKFAKPGESPVIRISYKMVDGGTEEDDQLKGKMFHKIVMEDKGIGFDNEFAEKIFMIFQRLHTQQSGYRGKGIGLAIAQRIMTNHEGIIMARGMINDGATFIMYFPAIKH